MRACWFLFAHTMRRIRTLLAASGVVLSVFQIFLIVVARSIHTSRAFDQINALIPPFIRALAGPSLLAFMSFGGIVSLGYFHVSVMSALIAFSISLGTTHSSEVEIGFIDLILSRPMVRHWVITRTIAIVISCTALLLGMMMAGTWIGLKTLAPEGAEWPSVRLVSSLAANLGLLMLCWGGVAVAIGSLSRRRGAAGAVTGLIAFATFLLGYVARAWEPAQAGGWGSPFRYYNPLDLVSGKAIPIKNVLVLTGIAVAGSIFGYIAFSRKDT